MHREALLNQWRESAPLIAPSMLKCDFANLHQDCARLSAAGAQVLHLDVMDGHFVPNLSYGPMVIESLRRVTTLPFDAHLMIDAPERWVDEYIQAGCRSITFHIEAQPQAGGLLERIRAADCVAGLALNPGTPLSRIEPFLGQCDLVLVMSVEPGFGGQAFQPAVLDKVTALRRQAPSGTVVAIDGGISQRTIGISAQAGAGMFVVGSAIFDEPDYGAAFTALRRMAEGTRHAPGSKA